MVTIKDGAQTRQVSAQDAFMLYLRKKALEGNEAAQERIEEIQAFRRAHDPSLASVDTKTIILSFVSPDNPNAALIDLKMAVKLYRFQPYAKIKLEPWLVQLALARLSDRRLTADEQAAILAVTHSPRKVTWPEWWEVNARPAMTKA